MCETVLYLRSGSRVRSGVLKCIFTGPRAQQHAAQRLIAVEFATTTTGAAATTPIRVLLPQSKNTLVGLLVAAH